jgi:hypothetical protein
MCNLIWLAVRCKQRGSQWQSYHIETSLIRTSFGTSFMFERDRCLIYITVCFDYDFLHWDLSYSSFYSGIRFKQVSVKTGFTVVPNISLYSLNKYEENPILFINILHIQCIPIWKRPCFWDSNSIIRFFLFKIMHTLNSLTIGVL